MAHQSSQSRRRPQGDFSKSWSTLNSNDRRSLNPIYSEVVFQDIQAYATPGRDEKDHPPNKGYSHDKTHHLWRDDGTMSEEYGDLANERKSYQNRYWRMSMRSGAASDGGEMFDALWQSPLNDNHVPDQTPRPRLSIQPPSTQDGNADEDEQDEQETSPIDVMKYLRLADDLHPTEVNRPTSPANLTLQELEDGPNPELHRMLSDAILQRKLKDKTSSSSTHTQWRSEAETLISENEVQPVEPLDPGRFSKPPPAGFTIQDLMREIDGCTDTLWDEWKPMRAAIATHGTIQVHFFFKIGAAATELWRYPIKPWKVQKIGPVDDEDHPGVGEEDLIKMDDVVSQTYAWVEHRVDAVWKEHRYLLQAKARSAKRRSKDMDDVKVVRWIAKIALLNGKIKKVERREYEMMEEHIELNDDDHDLS